MEKQVRYRVNVSSSVKGVLTFDATVEVTGGTTADAAKGEWIQDIVTQEEILLRSDALVAALKQRYPAEKKES
jgi:hypothetical protein